MTSRETILNAIRAGKPSPVSLPEKFPLPETTGSLAEDFAKILELIGGKAVFVHSTSEITQYLEKKYNTSKPVISLADGVAIGNVSANSVDDPHKYAHLELVVLTGHFGVAENAAIWFYEEGLVHRVLPFITQNLAVVLPADRIVANMHEAYEVISSPIGGYGVFIAGPSKTADIEQSLVIGAHGSRSMTVFLLKD
jgi:L-lactate dehydrogenase complex protein LldG